MQFFIFVLLICFLIFLFCLYILANDDFVLLRKDISIERVFNIAFLVAISSLISSRILFVILNPSSNFLNPLVFFLFPYFPGLSLTGGVIGGLIVFLIITYKDSKISKARLFDFFYISFSSTIAIGFLGYFLLSKTQLLSLYPISTIILYLALFIVFIKLLLPKLIAGNLKEGTVGLMFLISFSLISLVEHLIVRIGVRIGKAFHFTIEDFILIFVLIVSLVFLIIQEKFVARIKKYWEGKTS